MKLVSDRYMLMLNRSFEQLGRAPMRKRTFMAMMAILARRHQRAMVRQFDRDRKTIETMQAWFACGL